MQVKHLKKSSLAIFKNLNFGRVRLSGRSHGKLVNYSRSGGNKKIFRILDFNRYIWNIRGTILSFEYLAGRSASFSVLTYSNGVLSHILAISSLYVSSVVSSLYPYEFLEDRIGYCSSFKFLKPGSYIHNLELKKNKGSQYVRSSGNYSKLVSTLQKFAIIKLRSKFLLKIPSNCVATIGIILVWSSIFTNRNAGFSRRLGRKSHVRGVAKNPVDHPHGGGQGKTSGGRPSVSPWSYITKGLRTRRKLSYGTFVLKR